MNKLLHCFTLFYLIFWSLTSFAQVANIDSAGYESRVFNLGEIIVTGKKITDSLNSLSGERIESFNRQDVSRALNLLPGVSLAAVGPRNESVVYVRGFDLRQVPVFMDGIPVYVPYDGYVDLARLTTFDLAQIHVEKGFSSVLYGPNTLGGAINLVSRKPVKKLEFNGKAGIMSGEGYRLNLNAGSNLGMWYIQAGVSQLKRNYFPLSKNFTPVRFEDGSERDNSYRDDRKVSVKVGFTPNDRDEYAIGYINSHGKKGNPVYTGSDPKIQQRFWQWPYWDKQSLYFISNTGISAKTTLKSRWYYDTFQNALFSYDDTTYSTQTRPYTFQSFYDDYTLGSNVEFATRLLNRNTLKIAVHTKRDVHRENNLNEPQREFIDQTWSVSAEDLVELTDKLTLVPGLSYNTRNGVKAQDWNSRTQAISEFPSQANDAVNAQVGLFWQVLSGHILSASVERKTRFATFKDRYSYRMGAAIPNPGLKAENAINYDISFSGNIRQRLAYKTSMFRSQIRDVIQQVDNVEPNIFQLQNTGRALFFGGEASLEYTFVKSIKTGVNYSYIERNNLSNPEIKFTHVPVHKLFGYIQYDLARKLQVLVSMEANSDRYSTSYGTGTGGYALLHAKAGAQVYKFISLEAGINNLTDRNYSLVEGFPEEGRNYFVNLIFNIN